jgi:hypothetical protein
MNDYKDGVFHGLEDKINEDYILPDSPIAEEPYSRVHTMQKINMLQNMRHYQLQLIQAEQDLRKSQIRLEEIKKKIAISQNHDFISNNYHAEIQKVQADARLEIARIDYETELAFIELGKKRIEDE